METLMGHLSDTSYMDLPRNIVDSTKRVVLDLLGVTAAGSSAPEAQAVMNLPRGWGAGARAASWYTATGFRNPAPDWSTALRAMLQEYKEEYDLKPAYAKLGKMLGMDMKKSLPREQKYQK